MIDIVARFASPERQSNRAKSTRRNCGLGAYLGSEMWDGFKKFSQIKALMMPPGKSLPNDASNSYGAISHQTWKNRQHESETGNEQEAYLLQPWNTLCAVYLFTENKIIWQKKVKANWFLAFGWLHRANTDKHKYWSLCQPEKFIRMRPP